MSDDTGQDLSYLVPEVEVTWGTPPSFNTDPTEASGSSSSTSTVTPVEAFNINTGGVRAGEESFLGSLRNDTSQYDELRSSTMNAVSDPTFFGPATVSASDYGVFTVQVLETGSVAWNSQPNSKQETDDQKAQDQLAAMGQEFAAEINPIMEKGLYAIGNALEIAGQYIALINYAGQTYSKTDRSAKFPDPPSNSVVTGGSGGGSGTATLPSAGTPADQSTGTETATLPSAGTPTDQSTGSTLLTTDTPTGQGTGTATLPSAGTPTTSSGTTATLPSAGTPTTGSATATLPGAAEPTTG